jgi:hypothetical protein
MFKHQNIINYFLFIFYSEGLKYIPNINTLNLISNKNITDLY